MLAKEWTVNGLAVELGLDRATVKKRIGTLEPVRTDGDRKYYLMRDVFKCMNHAGDEKLDAQQEQAKLNQARREKVELETKVMLAELGRVEEFQSVVSEIITNAKTRLLSLPHKAAHQVLSATDYAEAESILFDLIREALDELSSSTAGIGEPGLDASAETDSISVGG